jgi:beta-N-acetylhexosaminidase
MKVGSLAFVHRRAFLRRSALLISSLLAACRAASQQAAPTAALPTAAIAVPRTTIAPAPAPQVGATARPAAVPTATAELVDSAVERLLQGMSLEQRVGQLMIVAFREDTVSPIASEMIRDKHVGGMILFTRNLGDPAHARELTGALQALARGSGGIPLFLGLDQEGGVVNRAAAGFTIWPSQMLLGAAGDPALVARAAQLTALELRAIGMNMNFAPVLDVNNNPANPVIGTRSFGADPARVAALGVVAIAAYQQAQMIAVGKHFPGHGDTAVDSHLALPQIDKSIDQLEQLELIPFRAAIDAGVDVIMTAHIDLPSITGAEPATLSPAVLTDMLRERLGYDGLIITDDLEMGAIVDQYGTAEAALRAFRAGADLLLFRFTEQEQRKGHALLLDAIRREPALAERLDASVRRILRLKLRRGLFVETPPPDLAEVGSAAHLTAAVDTAAAGLTLLRNQGGRLPLRLAADARLLVLAPYPADVATVEVPVDGALSLGEAITRKHAATTALTYALDPDERQRADLLAAAKGSAAVLVGTYDAQFYPSQRALVELLLAAGHAPIVVSLRLPYDIDELPDLPVYLAAYDDRTPTLLALADALFGVRAPAGRLPVPLGARYPLGYGLRDYHNS